MQNWALCLAQHHHQDAMLHCNSVRYAREGIYADILFLINRQPLCTQMCLAALQLVCRCDLSYDYVKINAEYTT
jgi:hypothetical protein